MGHNGSEDTCLHKTDAQGLHSRRTRRVQSLGRRSLTVDSSKLRKGSRFVHDSMRWDLMWPQSISPTNQSCATCKGASSRAEAARAVLLERGCRELCQGRFWASREHTGHATHEGDSATMRTQREPAGEATAGPHEGVLGRHAGWPRRAEPRDAGAKPHAPGAMAEGTACAAPGAPGAPRAGRAGPPRAATPAVSLRIGAARAPGGCIGTGAASTRRRVPSARTGPERRAYVPGGPPRHGHGGRSGWLGRLAGAGHRAEPPHRQQATREREREREGKAGQGEDERREGLRKGGWGRRGRRGEDAPGTRAVVAAVQGERALGQTAAVGQGGGKRLRRVSRGRGHAGM
jgi:hypothetical protein